MNMDGIGTAKVLSIRDCCHDEYWLRDRIWDHPEELGLGELQQVSKERTQSQGGRLDLLLKNPEDDSMFEVELQLGATDETHIIRTIEYWANEKRKWPKRSHTAVLVAEAITTRFFNVVQLLSFAVPIIGIQANVVEIGGARALHFTTIIDTYEEPEEGESASEAPIGEDHWIKNYPGNYECVKWYRALLEKLYGEVPAKYFDYYVSLVIGGVARVWVNRRKNNRVFIEVKIAKDSVQQVSEELNAKGVPCSLSGWGGVRFNVDIQQLKDNAETHEWLASELSPGNLKRAKEQTVGGQSV